MYQLVTSGTIAVVGETHQGRTPSRPWMFQTFVLEQKNDKYTDRLAFELWGENVLEEKNLQKGDFVKATLNISSREYNGKWYTSCKAQSIDKLSQQGRQFTQQPQPATDGGDAPNLFKGMEKYQGKPQPEQIEDGKDDLPF